MGPAPDPSGEANPRVWGSSFSRMARPAGFESNGSLSMVTAAWPLRWKPIPEKELRVVGPVGLEPTTNRL